MLRLRQKNVIFTVLCFILRISLVNTEVPKCATFEFPGLQRQKFFVLDENTMLDLTFYVSDSNCPKNLSLKYINIDRVDDGSMNPNPKRLCQFAHTTESCTLTSEVIDCFCPVDSTGSYQIRQTADRFYNGTWKWTSNPTFVNDKCVDIIVHYLPRVIKVYIWVDGSELQQGSIVALGSTVQIVCQLEAGYPSAEASVRLLKENGDVLASAETADYLNYTMQSVRCEDVGTVSCELEKSKQQTNTSLLVQCPPQFTGNSEYKDFATRLHFPFRSHTSNISCKLVSAVSTQGADQLPISVDCTRHASVLPGQPPHLMLVLNITERMSALSKQWRLYLSNDMGTTDPLEFSINSSPQPTTTTTSTTDKTDEEEKKSDSKLELSSTTIGLLLFIGNLGIIVVIVIAVIVIKRDLQDQQDQLEYHIQLRPLPYQPPHIDDAALQEMQKRRSHVRVSPNGHIYEEVDDDEADGAEGGISLNVSDAPSASDDEDDDGRPPSASDETILQRALRGDGDYLHGPAVSSQRKPKQSCKRDDYFPAANVIESAYENVLANM